MQLTQLPGLLLLTSVILGVTPAMLWADPWHSEKGTASYYGKGFAGRPTATGETFSPKEMTAAHRTLPLGSKAIVENLETGQQTEVKINDRGPYADPKRRIIDLSRAAAESVGLVERRGLAPVKVTVTEPPTKPKQGDEDYEVQVGAFEDATEARKVLKQVQQHYPRAYIDKRQGPSGHYYRVRVGPFEHEAEAKKIGQSLKQQGHVIFLDETPNTLTSTPP